MKRLLAMAISVVLLIGCSACTSDVQSPSSDTATTGASDSLASTTASANATASTTAAKSTTRATATQTPTTMVTAAPAQTVIVYQPIVIDTTKKPATTKKKPAAHTHSYSKKVTPATCTKKGYTTYTCSCGDSYVADYVNPSHSYSQYVCTKCKAVDKSHAYEYLVEWVKKNGEPDGAYMCINIWLPNGEMGSVNYSANGDYVYISLSYYDNEDFCNFMIHLDDGAYRAYKEDYYVGGYLPMSTYTSSSALPYKEYVGPDKLELDMAEYARDGISKLVKWFDGYLDSINIGITIADLGFTSY